MSGDDSGDAPVDWDVLSTLAAELEDDEIPLLVTAAYLEEVPERRSALADALAAGRCADLRAAAHALASASLSVGALPLGATCRAIERAVDESPDGRVHCTSTDPVRLLAEQALAELDRVEDALRRRYPGLG